MILICAFRECSKAFFSLDATLLIIFNMVLAYHQQINQMGDDLHGFLKSNQHLNIFRKVILCLVLYTEEVNLHIFVMISCKTVCCNSIKVLV